MFNNKMLKKLLNEDIYSFSVQERKWEFSGYNEPLYILMCDDWWEYVYIQNSWRDSSSKYDEATNEFLQYFKSSAFNEISSILPLVWLSYSKRLLSSDYIPSDFCVWALAILEWFDLDRYNVTYHLPEEEFTAIKNDLPLVISQLKNYPKERFAPPIGDKF